MEETLDPGQFGVTPDLFKEWRVPRFGNDNPQELKTKVWEWLVRSRLSGYASAKMMAEMAGGPLPSGEGPTWSFDRFGQSVTELSDGRKIYIGGEHEDHYMPDFCIYNDVVVMGLEGGIDFYCYRKSDFPPTDFHTATLVGEKIIIIGSLGYLGERNPGVTQLYSLSLANFEIHKLESSGSSPGWIHSHVATLSEDQTSIIVTQGKVDPGGGHSLRENIEDWKLNLHDCRWERLTQRNWAQFEVRRKDGMNIHLFEIRTMLLSLMLNLNDEYQQEMSRLSESLGYRPDAKQIKDLYTFDFEHGDLQKDEQTYNLFFVTIQGVRVRFTEGLQGLQVVIEGRISAEKEGLIKRQLVDKLSALESSPCELEEY
jgi:hypothetical protein